MKVKIDINPVDYWNFNKFVMLKEPTARRNFIITMIINPLIILTSLLFIGSILQISISVVLIIAIILGAIADLHIIYKKRSHIMKTSYNNQGILGEHTIEINEKGVRETTSVNDAFNKWEGIYKVTQNSEYIYIFLNSMLAHLIPKRAFNSIDEANEFYNKSVDFWKIGRNI